MNSDPIFLILRSMYDSGDLGGRDITYKGDRLVPVGDDDVDPIDLIAWADDGLSVDRSKFGGRMCRLVEQYRAKLLAGDEDDQEAGKRLTQYFCRLADIGPDTSPFVEYQIRTNNEVVMVEGMMSGRGPRHVWAMREYSAQYLVKGTQEPEWGYPPSWTVDRNPDRVTPGEWIPNHRICTPAIKMGEHVHWTADDLLAWAKAQPIGTKPGWKPPTNG